MMNIAGAVIKKMIEYFDGDVERINHALKVYGFAKSIGELENLPEEKLSVLEVAAILHDIGIKLSEIKYGSAEAKYQELEGPPAAVELLQDLNLSQDFLDRVCFLIGNHHSYHRIDDLDFQILVEADFLVNIYEGGFDRGQVDKIKEKYFETATGMHYLERMYRK